MIDDDVVIAAAIGMHRIIRISINIAQPATQVTDDEMIGLQRNGISSNADTRSGSGLSGNGDAVVRDFQGAFQINDSRHAKHDGTMPGTQCIAQAAGPAIIQVGDFIHIATPAAPSQPSAPFSSRESQIRLSHLSRTGAG